ncbi:hypothetical protein HU200_035642 [Digitaria exilis]|uniref:Uncharacterized protein n=1 Tax=Digitaria exilis TaxID=1010633 RepID=A0A835BFA3_9POAL|nr:hypothetical protein HU200_035642 [Digitaria exilis]
MRMKTGKGSAPLLEPSSAPSLESDDKGWSARLPERRDKLTLLMEYPNSQSSNNKIVSQREISAVLAAIAASGFRWTPLRRRPHRARVRDFAFVRRSCGFWRTLQLRTHPKRVYAVGRRAPPPRQLPSSRLAEKIEKIYFTAGTKPPPSLCHPMAPTPVGYGFCKSSWMGARPKPQGPAVSLLFPASAG